MAKQKTLKTYVEHLTARCLRKYGQEFVDNNEELIEVAAKNKRLLDRFDDAIDKSDLLVVSTGSQGQMKEEINPMVKHRNDVAKQYADNLDALQLTARSRYKKSDGQAMNNADDPMSQFFNNINNG